ncbi:MAG: sulfite exporter TauE/SafE family protein [Gemmatimonadetes bacterium]|nr:sulfite exporter TauE/SafE family protein [Gemmatimonadota bacterium]
MTLANEITIGVLVCIAAALYSAVGHGGASGYLAVMALFGVSAVVMRPAALTLNVLVAGIAAVKFYRAGRFSWRILWPFAVTSVPAAFVGGRLLLPAHSYRIVLGLVLLFCAGRMLLTSRSDDPRPEEARKPPITIALALGAGIGLLSGLTGVGGGIFLSPILLLFGWADIRRASGVAALFIVVNSLSGLLGYASSGYDLPSGLPYWAAAAMLGGWLGSEYGSRRAPIPALYRLLAAVLLVAGVKLIFA